MNTQTKALFKLFCLIIQTILVMTILGCKSEDKTPHLRDPIYLDLKKSHDQASAVVELTTKQIEELESDYSKAEVRTIDRKTIQKELLDARKAYQTALQMREYYKAKLKLREAEAKISYKRAFLKNDPWPDPNEYESYLLQKRLNEIPRNWSERLKNMGESHQDIVSLPDSPDSGH